MSAPGTVLPSAQRLTEADTRRLIAGGLLRLCHGLGPARVALEIGCDEKTVRNARDEKSSLKLHSALNLLSVDPGALDPLLAAYGFRLAPIASDSSNDYALLAEGAQLTALHAVALADGVRDHGETLEIADAARTVIARYQPIIAEADRLRGLGTTRSAR